MNVAYEIDAFVDDTLVSLTTIPIGALTKLILSISEMLGSHNVSADRLKLIGTPTCASKQRTRGRIMGAN